LAQAWSDRVRKRGRAVSDRGATWLPSRLVPLQPEDGVRSPPLLSPC